MPVELIAERPDVITVFLRSMARHWQGQLIAVIVSGYDGDGAAALRDIRRAGGISIAQKLDTASRPDMPEDTARKIVEIAGAERASAHAR